MESFELPVPGNLEAIPPTDMPESLILGKRAECFFEQAIRQSSRFELLAQNLQVFEDQRTLGEFDFFIEDQLLSKALHVELVYKFYLYDPKISSEINRWIGPNRKDSLVRKLDRLKNHQFPLIKNPHAKRMLQLLGLQPEDFGQQLCFKAHLFVPKLLRNRDFPLINPACIAGYWIFRKDFQDGSYEGFEFFSPKKADWPVEPENNTQWKSFECILQEVDHLLQHQKTALLWMKKTEHLYERLFVVWWEKSEKVIPKR